MYLSYGELYGLHVAVVFSSFQAIARLNIKIVIVEAKLLSGKRKHYLFQKLYLT